MLIPGLTSALAEELVTTGVVEEVVHAEAHSLPFFAPIIERSIFLTSEPLFEYTLAQ